MYKPNRLQRIQKAHPELTLDQIRMMLCGAYVSYNSNPANNPGGVQTHLAYFTQLLEQMTPEDVEDLFPLRAYKQ